MQASHTIELDYMQKKLLVTYEKFFGIPYIPQNGGNDDSNVHTEAEGMCYLLKIFGCEIGFYNFSWSTHGPYSPGLLVLLRSIDRLERTNTINGIESRIMKFYRDKGEKKRILYGNDNNSKIGVLSEILDIDKNFENKTQWVEILSSLLYLTVSVLPMSNFETINDIFMTKMPSNNNIEINKYAWDLLKKANLVTRE